MDAKKYEPQSIEMKWYQKWEENGYFKPSMDLKKMPFSIQLPPPNVTGVLHMGHAFNQTIMDALIRYHRMKGENVCWIPGSDHSGIATQIVVERQLAAEGLSRQDLGREAFLEKIWQWKEISGGTMKQQMKRLGCSVDWSREYFTMDEARAKVVTEVFVRLYEQGLIYKGKRLVNWDVVLGTAVSDLEVENTEESGSMWYIKYCLKDDPDQFLTVATTRPETLLGDVAIAVHPEDDRYRQWIGREVMLPLTDRTIPIIADAYVERDFGTGCVKVTPAHDFNDYQVGQRHNTPIINIFTLTGQIRNQAEVYTYSHKKQPSYCDLPKQYQGLDRFEARKRMIQDLTERQLLLGEKSHIIMMPRGDRTGTVIEPMLTDQWFVAMNQLPENGSSLSLGEQARMAVHSGKVSFIPENWVNTYNQWMNHLQDWCISRQLWWGHQIPAWYDEAGNVYVARNYEEAVQKAGTSHLIQDVDVLDTWFSSALVPFSTLGWPLNTDEMKVFLPSSVLVTGHEIIFFWVARMIMLTTHFTGKVPFHKVYIHGIVRDHKGKKMSKSEGNVIDPVDIIEGVDLDNLLAKRTTGLRRPEKAEQIKNETKKLFPNGITAYGADALRFTMASYASLGRSINFDLKRCEGYRNFCNKIWNAARFVLMNVENQDCGQDKNAAVQLSFVDEWILGRLEVLKQSVTEAYENYRFDLVTQLLYDFIWNEYCDWYVELAKVQLQRAYKEIRRATRKILVQILEVCLRLLHPIMPFITEEIWQIIAPLANAKSVDSIMLAQWPMLNSHLNDSSALKKMNFLKALINAIRNLKAEMNLNIAVKPPLIIEAQENSLLEYLDYLPVLARVSEVSVCSHLPNLDAPIGVIEKIRFLFQIEFDKTAEMNRLQKELEKIEKSILKIESRLSKPGYQEKAPSSLVQKDKEEMEVLVNKKNKIAGLIKQFKSE